MAFVGGASSWPLSYGRDPGREQHRIGGQRRVPRNRSGWSLIDSPNDRRSVYCTVYSAPESAGHGGAARSLPPFGPPHAIIRMPHEWRVLHA